ncbi:hypothetical protein TEQG_04756 [Trichophyton equinum CBS 127.97]|uniref:Uncharacterized protein n=1 Tax=Trichophyton equinum (strain ATCC MYA-4606 / CBS 127.97) TaxID=559882 RepID=F2PV31_TRIEC|nr:hypothetical protein TEQG_04756 [Trichophyton equinum CBS 127.97]
MVDRRKTKCGKQNTLLLKKEKNEEGRRRVYDMGSRKDATNRPTSQPTTATTATRVQQQTHHPSIRPTDRPSIPGGGFFYNEVICIMGEGDECNNEEPTKGNNTTTQQAFYHQVNDNQTNDEYPVSSIQ